VTEPRKVEQIKINFAQTAKFVDVKALKETIWNQISEPQTKTKNGNNTEVIKSFGDLLSDIPKRVPEESLSNISVPFCFICLLHLANEKGITLDQEQGNLSELFIHNNTKK